MAQNQIDSVLGRILFQHSFEQPECTHLAPGTHLPTSLRAAAALSVLFGVGAAAVMATTLAFLLVRGEPPSPWGILDWGRGGFFEGAGIAGWRAGVTVALLSTASDGLIGRQLQFARRRAGYLTLAKVPVDVAWIVGVGTPLVAAVVYAVRLVLVLAAWRHLRPRRSGMAASGDDRVAPIR